MKAVARLLKLSHRFALKGKTHPRLDSARWPKPLTAPANQLTFQNAPPPWPPIEARPPLRPLPCFNRRLHPRPTGCFSIPHQGDKRAHWAPPRRFAGASTSLPASLRVGPQSAHLFQPSELRPPIPSILAMPKPPAPGGTDRRRDLSRPLARSPRKRVQGLLEPPCPTGRASHLSGRFPRSGRPAGMHFPRGKVRSGPLALIFPLLLRGSGPLRRESPFSQNLTTNHK